ncbi:MAG: DUF6056 family protein [Prevotella sp.]|jgi:hypothetical protein|nr:DUF6056 family protein [Prevotella sp.]
MNDFLYKAFACFGKKYFPAEQFASKDKPRMALFFLAIAFTFTAVYILNYMLPYWFDDFNYSFNWVTGKRVENFQDIIDTQYKHYFEWGGRIVAHTILQTLLWWGKTYSDLLNSAIYVVYILAIYRIANLKAKQKYNLHLFIAVNLLAWFLHPSWSISVLPLSGSCNYLWMTTLALLFLYPYCKLYIEKENAGNRLCAIYLFLGGLIVGWSHENTAVGTVAFVAILFFRLYRERRKIPAWAKIGFAGLLVGAAILLLAPGNQERMDVTIQEYNQSDLLFFRLLHGIYMIAYHFFYSGIPVLGAIVVFGILYNYFGKPDADAKRRQTLACMLTGAGAAIFLSMIASPVFKDRCWFGITSFVIIGILFLYRSLDFRQRFIATSARVLIPPLVLLMFSQYFFMSKDIYHIRQTAIAREAQVKEQKKQGITDIVIREKQTEWLSTRLPYRQRLHPDPKINVNDSYALYYGVNTVRVEYE